MVNLGNLYAQGKGVARNDALALAWFRRAAEAPVVLTAWPRGLSLNTGSELYGIPAADTTAAVRDMALLLVAWAYAEGLGVPVDKAQAETWFRIWADAADWPGRRQDRLRTLTQLNIQP